MKENNKTLATIINQAEIYCRHNPAAEQKGFLASLRQRQENDKHGDEVFYDSDKNSFIESCLALGA